MLRAPRRSDSLDQPAAKNAVRPDHQRENHENVRGKILRAATDIRVEIPGGQVLGHADDQPAHYRSDNRVEAAQNHDGKHLEPDDGKLIVDPEHGTPDDT